MTTTSTTQRIATLIVTGLLVSSAAFAAVPYLFVGTTAAATSGATLIDDAEDNDTNIETSGWSGWGKDTGNLSATSAHPINGSYSFELSSSNGVSQVVANASSSLKPDRVAYKMNLSKGPQGTTDGAKIFTQTGGTQLAHVDFDDSSGSITIVESTGRVDTGVGWEAGKTYYVELTNISFADDQFTLIVNGKDLGRYGFRNTATSMDQILFQHDTNDAGISRQMWIDDVQIKGSKFGTPYTSVEFSSFENEPADAGVPNGMEAVTDPAGQGWSRTTTAENVTTARSFNGSQSYYAQEGSTGNVIYTRPKEQPYLKNRTTNVSIVLNRPSTDLEGTGDNSGSTAIKLFDKTGEREDISVAHRDGALRYYNATGTLKNITQKVNYDEWVRVKVYNIDPSTDTFSVYWRTGEGESGRATGLEMRNNMGSNGYSSSIIAIDDAGFIDGFGVGTSGPTFSSGDISGRVVSQSGAGIANATVEVYGSKKPTVSESRDQLETLSDPTPNTFSDQLSKSLDLHTKWKSLDGRYVGAYTKDQVNDQPWTDSADLQNPNWRQVPADQPIAFVIGDAGDNPGLLGSTEEYNRQVPGTVQSEGTVVIEKLSADESTVDRQEFTLDEEAGGGWGDPSSLNYAEATLSPGFYRVSAKDGSFSYVLQAGSTSAIMDNQLEGINDKLTQSSKDIQDAINGGSVVRKTVQTNSTGHWSASLPSGVKVVHAQAVKVGDVDGKVTMDQARTGFKNDTYDGSIYLPSRPKRVDVPNNDVRIYMTELTWPPNGNLSDLQTRLDELEDLLNKTQQTLMDPPMPAEPDAAVDELRQRYNDLAGLIRASPELRDAYLEFSERDSIASADDLSESELRNEITSMNRALGATTTGGTAVPDETDVGQDTISQSWTINGINLDSSNVSVVAHYTNGTTKTVDETYIAVDSNTFRDGGTVRLEDYPLGSTDPAGVEFELAIAGESGVARGNAQATNPTFDGELPELRGININTLTPGPDQRVEMQTLPSDDSSFRQITDATVFAPDGTERAATVENGDTVSFSTAGQGVHTARLTIQTTGGHNITETVRLQARASDLPSEPSVVARSSPIGVYALAGDGLSGGDVDIESDRVRVSARIPEDNEPRRIHVYTDALSADPSTPTEIQLTQGENDRQLRKHVFVKYHTKAVPDETLTWRNYDGGFVPDGQPITESGETKYGSVTKRTNGTLVSTYTGADGRVSIQLDTSPSRTDRAVHAVRVRVGDIDIPGLVTVPPVPEFPPVPSPVPA